MNFNPSEITDYIRVKQNDTSRILYDQLFLNGSPLSLVSSSVKLNLYNLTTSANAQYTANITVPASGSVNIQFPATEIATTGSYLAEWQVTLSDATELTVPTEGYILIRVIDDLD